jgi:hypothetical protein
MNNNENLWQEIPSFAYISLARRGMEKISLDQCFLKNCDNKDIKLLEPFKMEESEDDKKSIKKIYIKCKKCGGTFILKLETIKNVVKPKNSTDEKDSLSMGLIYALDAEGKNIGHIGYY